MGRIGVTLAGVERLLLRQLNINQAQTAQSTLRLATRQRINAPSDDPSGFLTLAGLQAQLTGVAAALDNVTTATSIVSQTATNLSALQTQLENIRDVLLTDADQSLTPPQRSAAQANIDTALGQINVLARTAAGGRRMLDGSAMYRVSGRNSEQVANVMVYGVGAGSRSIAGEVLTAAQQATLTYTGASGQISADAQFTLSGSSGSAAFTVTNGQALSDVATTINDQSYITGVTASVNNDTLTLTSVGAGSAATARVAVQSGTFIVAAGQITDDAGVDTVATINGQTYTGVSTARGNRVTVNDNGTHYDIQFEAGFTGGFDTLSIDTNLPTFALSPDLNQTAALSLPALDTTHLGGLSGALSQIGSGGTASGLAHNTAQALRIVDEALAQVILAQGQVGGFQTATIESASGLLSGMQTNLQDAIDTVDYVDAEAEKDRISYYEGLTSNAQAGLTILYQQRQSIIDLIRNIAGLSR